MVLTHIMLMFFGRQRRPYIVFRNRFLYGFVFIYIIIYTYTFFIYNIILNREQRKKKKEMGLQLLVTAKTINYCSGQIICQTKVQQPKIEALLKF